MENRICLSHGVQVTGATRQAVTRIVAGVGDLVQRTGDSQAQVGFLVWLCAEYTMHKEMMSVGFLVWPQNHGRRFLPIWPQN
jgi:hypothetical protein